MKKYNVKARIYDSGKKYESYPDRYAILYMIPKEYRNNGLKGIYLGCRPTEDGMIRCTWEEVKTSDRIGVTVNLGKRIPIEHLPAGFRHIVRKMDRVYNRALNENTEQAWAEWYRC